MVGATLVVAQLGRHKACPYTSYPSNFLIHNIGLLTL